MIGQSVVQLVVEVCKLELGRAYFLKRESVDVLVTRINPENATQTPVLSGQIGPTGQNAPQRVAVALDLK